MDVNEVLWQFRKAADRWVGSDGTDIEAAETAINAAEALDNWMSKGGFAPDEWKK